MKNTYLEAPGTFHRLLYYPGEWLDLMVGADEHGYVRTWPLGDVHDYREFRTNLKQVTAMAADPSTGILVIADSTGRIECMSLYREKPLFSLECRTKVTGLALVRPDDSPFEVGLIMASRLDGVVNAYSLANGRLLSGVDPSTGMHRMSPGMAIMMLAFMTPSPDQRTLLMGIYSGDGGGSVELWDTKTFAIRSQHHTKKRLIAELEERPVEAVLGHDGKRFYVASESLVSWYHTSTCERIGSWKHPKRKIQAMSVSHDDRFLAVGYSRTGEIYVYNLVRDHMARCYDIHPPGNHHQCSIHALAFTPDNQLMAACSGGSVWLTQID